MNNGKKRNEQIKNPTPKDQPQTTTNTSPTGLGKDEQENTRRSKFQMERKSPKNGIVPPGGNPGNTSLAVKKDNKSSTSNPSTSQSTPQHRKTKISSPTKSPSTTNPESRKNKKKKKYSNSSSEKKSLEEEKRKIIEEILNDPISKIRRYHPIKIKRIHKTFGTTANLRREMIKGKEKLKNTRILNKIDEIDRKTRILLASMLPESRMVPELVLNKPPGGNPGNIEFCDDNEQEEKQNRRLILESPISSKVPELSPKEQVIEEIKRRKVKEIHENDEFFIQKILRNFNNLREVEKHLLKGIENREIAS